ncbi:leucine Rich Repeat protein [Alistipes sp. CAG:435]|nr:leucine Rich Repeat protein [Alistipes sp. CAG:435]
MKLLNIFTNILVLSSMAVSVACNETEERGSEARTINAVIVQPDTRTSLNGPDANGVYKTVWSPGDQIMVFSGDLACRYILKSGENTNKGVFEGYGNSEDLVAVYPLSIGFSRTGATIEVGLPEVQEYVSGNIPLGAYPMLGIYGDETFSFRNLCSVLKVPMFGDATVKSITFTPNNAGVKASGKAVINVNSTQLEMDDNSKPSVKLDCPDVKLSAQPTDFHFVVPAQIYPGGFTLTIATDKGDVVKTLKSDITLDRSVLYPIEAFECKIDSKENIIFEDANFKAYLVANFDTDGDGEISYEEALAITMIDVDTDNIESLAGIEHMANLTELNCEGPFVMSGYEPEEGRGKLKTLDVSKNTKLTKLYCGFNQFSSLDLTSNVLLERLRCAGNDLNNLDVSKNTELTRLTAYNNHLSLIDVSYNTKLEVIDLSNNQIKSIDISKNESLATFNCDDNLLTELDPSNNQKLTNIYCSNNNLSSINVRKNQKLAKLVIIGNSIPQIDLRNNSELTHLFCEKNKISELDLSNNTKLRQLTVNDNSLSSLTVNCCPEIKTLKANNNLIKEMDISELTSLFDFYCSGNPLETLYVFDGQIDAINNKEIPSTTKIVVKGTEPGEDEVFTVTPTLFDIDGYEQDITMTVTANISYSIDSQPEWISKKSDNSGVYTFTVSANTTSSSRRGEIIFKNANNSFLTVTVKQRIQTYTSSDYSQDGQVTRIHSATVGKGIDVVFVGDAFADKDQDLFNKYVELGKEAFFTEEPFRSTMNRFNIYRIGSVSKNGIITQEGGDTKFSAQFGQGTYVGGDNNLVNSFVKASIPSVDLTKTIIFVIINKAKYAGTCHMFSNNQAVCYVPLCRNENEYAQTLRHEGCGHGFGKLADEYFYDSMGRIPDDEVSELKKWKGFAYGFHENVDLTSDPNTILWSKFISDSRYSGKVGVHEGGYTYPYGVYRPTHNSIMRYNTGGFNAPSREAIYKKIMKFSEGDAWTYDYETFVAFDAPARSAKAVTRAAAQCAAVDKANFIPLAPPVMVMVDK